MLRGRAHSARRCVREARQRSEFAARSRAAAALTVALVVWLDRRSAVAEVERLRALRGTGRREAAATRIQAAVRVRRCAVYLLYWYKSRNTAQRGGCDAQSSGRTRAQTLATLSALIEP